MILRGKILFDPDNFTKKHLNQSSWKRMALLMFNDDTCNYYKWFIEKRYNLILNIPIRGPHISFINDSVDDIMKSSNLSIIQANDLWNEVKTKWDRKKIEIEINTDVRTDGNHWWLQIPETARTELHNIRKELHLERPFFGLHISIGYANSKNVNHSNYIHGLIKKFGNEYN